MEAPDRRSLTAYDVVPGVAESVAARTVPASVATGTSAPAARSKTSRTSSRAAARPGQRHALRPAVQANPSLKARAAAAVDPGWARRTAIAAGIPLPALTAYARASVLAPPACHIGWNTLAGIGWVESQHGTIDGRRLRPDGLSNTRILGPALTGVGALAAIPATRLSAQWHGNRTWDHAVGPMQFIPSTWRTWQTDGDGDGIADPNDIDDASLAAARYLCQSGDLVVGDNWTRAILSYNFSTDYLHNVYVATGTYTDRTG